MARGLVVIKGVYRGVEGRGTCAKGLSRRGCFRETYVERIVVSREVVSGGHEEHGPLKRIQAHHTLTVPAQHVALHTGTHKDKPITSLDDPAARPPPVPGQAPVTSGLVSSYAD